MVETKTDGDHQPPVDPPTVATEQEEPTQKPEVVWQSAWRCSDGTIVNMYWNPRAMQW
jgi:hypothetical protein